MFLPSKPSDVKQDSKEQIKNIGYQVFSWNWIHSSLQFKWMQTGVFKSLKLLHKQL